MCKRMREEHALDDDVCTRLSLFVDLSSEAEVVSALSSERAPDLGSLGMGRRGRRTTMTRYGVVQRLNDWN